jgi:hypothetical protein
MPHHGGDIITFREALFFISLEISCSERDGGKSRKRFNLNFSGISSKRSSIEEIPMVFMICLRSSGVWGT